MREILFIGKSKESGEWIYGVPCYFDDSRHIVKYLYNAEGGYVVGAESEEVIPDTIGQYTGLKDKNGTKIFEGDIFKFNDEVFDSYDTDCGTEYNSCEVENYAVVGFCENTGKFDFIKYKFYNNQVEADLHENHDIEFYDFISELEVIGNIHDNPELLKGARE